MKERKRGGVEFPKALLATRAKQLQVRAKGHEGMFVARKSTERKPKGSRNVQVNVKVTTLTDTSSDDEVSEETRAINKLLSGEVVRPIPIMDLNSSFDDIDTCLLYTSPSPRDS